MDVMYNNTISRKIQVIRLFSREYTVKKDKGGEVSMSGITSVTFTAVILVSSVIFVNGLTDAPNAIATCVTTRSLSVRQAVFMSAVLNFFGVFISGKYSAAVTDTIMNMVDFGGNEKASSVALCGAMFSIVLWAVSAWYFGIPTSESHALVAGLTGSALSVNGSFAGININQWIKAIYGLVFSCLLGLVGGYVICRIIIAIFRNINRSKSKSFFRWGQIFAAAAMSFMHGAQDGQKFVAALLMCISADGVFGNFNSIHAILFCSFLMAAGTLSGGKKIIKSVGMDMVRLERYQGFSADIAGAISLFLSTLRGFPVSTTHAKTMAMVGSALAGGKNRINPQVIKDMILAWIFTFPGCGLLSFGVTKIFLRIF